MNTYHFFKPNFNRERISVSKPSFAIYELGTSIKTLAIFIIFFTIFTFPSCKKLISLPELKIKTESSLKEHTKEFKKEIIKVREGVYVAIGYGLANSILITAPEGNIIIDTMESMEEAKKVKEEFQKINSAPIKAIIYTHNHPDHVFGSGVYADSNPEVIAHETTLTLISKLATKNRPAIGTRSMRMFGTYLDDKELENAGIGPFLRIGEGYTTGLLKPTKTFSDSLKISIAGLNFHLYHAPGETDDQILIHIPEWNTIFIGDNFYRSFPNLYTIRGTPYRDLVNWYKSIDKARYLYPEYLVPSHTRPLKGKDSIFAILTDYRDAIQFVHDQSIRAMNMGLTPDEAVEKIKLPSHLKSSPYLQEYYGKVEWSVRSVYTGELGWYSGNSTDLEPLTKKEQKNLLFGFATESQILEEALKYFENKKYRESLYLSDILLQNDSENKKAKALRVDILIALGSSDKNANSRHYYLTEAKEISGNFIALEKSNVNAETVHVMQLPSIFEAIVVNLDPVESANYEKKVNFEFTDTNEVFTIHARKGIAEIRSTLDSEADIHLKLDSKIFKEMLGKLRSPIVTIPKFTYIKGNAIEFALFFKHFEPKSQKLPYEKIK